MSACCGNECNWRNFGFRDCKAEQFYTSLCGQKIVFVIYRVMFFLYALSFIIADRVVLKEDFYPIFLTNWTEVTGCIYFGVAFLVALYGLTPFASKNSDLKWFHIIQWILFNVSFSAAFVTDLLFWAALSGQLSYSAIVSPFNIQSHAINLLMLLIDLFVSRFPIRILHFVYPASYGLVYMFFTLILYWSGTRDGVYSILNWARNPGLSAGLSLGAAFVGMPIAHMLLFGLFQLRVLINRRCCKTANDEDENINNAMEMGQANLGFE